MSFLGKKGVNYDSSRKNLTLYNVHTVAIEFEKTRFVFLLTFMCNIDKYDITGLVRFSILGYKTIFNNLIWMGEGGG